jgi:anti-sigma B factor antagonist
VSDEALHVERRVDGSTAVLRATGEIDMTTAPVLAEEFEQAIAGEPAMVVIDLSDITFFGSAGIAALLDAREQCVSVGCTLRVVTTSRPVLRSLEIAGVLGLLPVYSTLAEATS